jgi:SRSO17 transposase
VRPRADERRKGTRTKTSETRYIREIVFGKRRERTYWEVTTEPETRPENSTSFIMTNIQDKRSNLKRVLGNFYGLRTWVEYSFRQCKQELGWTDYRFTNFPEINKWWEIIMSTYLMISLNTQTFLSLNSVTLAHSQSSKITINFTYHSQWNTQTEWKNVLNNFRLIIQPTLLLWLIFPWLEVFPNSSLLLELHRLIYTMNQFQPLLLSG